MPKTTISSKHQITLPKSLLEEVGLKIGNKLIIKVKNNRIILEPQPKSLVQYYKGLGKESWKKLGGGEIYLKRERKSW
ncbi:MAG: AbrB/MazE/SpoVT family DNA-binding domain-containing protein [Patescibacteria group bacterium]